MTAHRSLFAAALLLAFSPGSPGAEAQEPAPARGDMTVSFLEGGATGAQRGGSAQPLAVGAVLHEGDVVETAPGGRVEISLATGTLLRIGESSRVELREAPPSGSAFRARLLLGNLWAKVHKLVAGERFEVETENAVAGVRGTEFRVEAAGGKGEDLVRVYEGAVEVNAHKGLLGKIAWSHRVEPDRELRFARGKVPAGPAAFEPASEAKHPFMSWVRERHASRGPEVPPGKPGVAPGQRAEDKKGESRDAKKGEPREEKKGEGRKNELREKEKDGKRDEKKEKDDEKHEKKRHHL